jgi:hypothetical protein
LQPLCADWLKSPCSAAGLFSVQAFSVAPSVPESGPLSGWAGFPGPVQHGWLLGWKKEFDINLHDRCYFSITRTNSKHYFGLRANYFPMGAK